MATRRRNPILRKIGKWSIEQYKDTPTYANLKVTNDWRSEYPIYHDFNQSVTWDTPEIVPASVKAAVKNIYKKMNKQKANPRVTSSSLLPAKVRINPRTGKVQVFVSPKVAAQVKGNRRNPWFSRTKDAIKGNRYMVLDTDKVPVHAGILTKKQALEVAKEARQAGEKVRLVKAK